MTDARSHRWDSGSLHPYARRINAKKCVSA